MMTSNYRGVSIPPTQLVLTYLDELVACRKSSVPSCERKCVNEIGYSLLYTSMYLHTLCLCMSE